MSTFNIDTARSNFVKHIKDAYAGEGKFVGGINGAAMVCVETADALAYGEEWTTMHATKLPLYLREFHIALTTYLNEKGHVKPAMYWKRIREVAEATYASRAKAANGGQEPAVEESESDRERLRRLTEEGIQAMYSRIKKATLSPMHEADIDIMSLMPNLRDMADSIGYTLVEPSSK